jgi:hypothetical protein
MQRKSGYTLVTAITEANIVIKLAIKTTTGFH